jgi:hypothetical protein
MLQTLPVTDERRDHNLGMAPTTPRDAAGTLDVPGFRLDCVKCPAAPP